MNRQLRFIFRVLGLMAVLLLAATVSAQSLGEAARKVRGQKGAPAKATRVYTNDNLPRQGGLSTTNIETEAKAKEGEKGKEREKGKEAEAKKSPAEEEKTYREKFAKLRETLSMEERKLEVLQREFNLANVQFYSDPNVALREQTQRSELVARQQEIERQKAAIEAAKKAIADLEEEVRRKALPPGVAR